MTFDPYTLREQFPSLAQQVNGRPAVFFDGPGGTQTPVLVIEAMGAYLSRDNSNLGGAFATSERTVQVAAEARQAMADLLNARRPEEIAFGQNMTSLTFAASRAIARTWQPGDEIIVTWLDHDANITPWVMAAADRGVTVRWLEFRPEDCSLDLRRLAELLNERTRLVAVTYASNAVGTIVDVARVTELAHQAGALVYVDAVHYTPHNPVDVQAVDCDFLACSAYKFFGPHSGIMYGKYDLLDNLEAYKVRPAPGKPPGKWETGTQSFESLAGVKAAVDYLEEIGEVSSAGAGETLSQYSGRPRRLKQALEAIKEYEAGLSRHFLERATAVPGLRVYGITDVERLEERAPTFAVSLEGHTPRQVAEFLGRQGIFVWDGHYYAVAVMDQLGTLDKGGLVRIGFVHYNTVEEIDRAIDALVALGSD
ncbi:MAG: cysteine desulfurase-like protein [Chloroflexota bacterium]|nr:MAG: cysteine desulfurase-like protein [Chloroflexota bacterium]